MSTLFSSLTPLLSPKTVGVIGASDDPGRIGGRPIAYMKARGFRGAILPVNPKRAEVQGLTAYASVDLLPEVPDVAIIAVPAEHVLPAIRALAARGTKGAILFSAGFAEMDAAGASAQADIVAAARAGGMRLLGPNCLGLFNDRVGFYPIFSSSLEGGFSPHGRVGIASQSGAFGTHLFVAARDRNIGTPICVTTGNEGDVTIGELIGWLAEDPDTDVIAAYAEGIREPATFLAALEAARAARKPVVMMKVGRSALGQAAAQSHTASVAGDDAVIDAVMAEFGVVRAHTIEGLLDIVYAATRRIYPARNTLGMITVSGGAGVLVSDLADTLGLAMPPMPPATQARLRALVPFAAPVNPVDCTAQVFNDMSLVGQFAEAVVSEGGYPSILTFFSQVGASPTIAPRLRPQLREVVQRHPDRLHVLSVLAPTAMLREYEADGFLVFEDPSRAVFAIEAMGRFGAAFARPAGLAPPALPPIALPPKTPSEAAAKALLAQAGIISTPERIAQTGAAAVAAAEALGFPVVLKILSPDILHKTEIGGVLLDVGSAEAVAEGYDLLSARAGHRAPGARIEGVLVAKQLRGGVECILGIHNDPVFGPIAMFGLGGIFIEVMNDVVFRRCPFGVDVAEAMIRSIRGIKLLLGVRGQPAADIGALADMLARLSVFAASAGQRLKSVDLNPVFARPDGAFAADAIIEIE